MILHLSPSYFIQFLVLFKFFILFLIQYTVLLLTVSKRCNRLLRLALSVKVLISEYSKQVAGPGRPGRRAAHCPSIVGALPGAAHLLWSKNVCQISSSYLHCSASITTALPFQLLMFGYFLSISNKF